MKFTTSLVGSIVTYPMNLNPAIKVSTMQFTLQQTWLLSSINTHNQIHQDLDKRWILPGLLSDTSPVLHNVLHMFSTNQQGNAIIINFHYSRSFGMQVSQPTEFESATEVADHWLIF